MKMLNLIWATMKRPNLKTIGVEKGEDSQLKIPPKFNNHRRKFPIVKGMPLKIKEAYRAPYRLAQKRKS